MKGEVRKYVLIDTCFWIALFKPNDPFHKNAKEILAQIDRYYFRLPWPTLYEFINTRLVTTPSRLAQFTRVMASPGIIREDDTKYRERSLKLSIERTSNDPALSLTDSVIRLMAEDRDLCVDYLVSYDNDLRSSITRNRGIEILPAQVPLP
jgi:predicted nucleic acid-binding protein